DRRVAQHAKLLETLSMQLRGRDGERFAGDADRHREHRLLSQDQHQDHEESSWSQGHREPSPAHSPEPGGRCLSARGHAMPPNCEARATARGSTISALASADATPCEFADTECNCDRNLPADEPYFTA